MYVWFFLFKEFSKVLCFLIFVFLKMVMKIVVIIGYLFYWIENNIEVFKLWKFWVKEL